MMRTVPTFACRAFPPVLFLTAVLRLFADASEVRIVIDPGSARSPISPYIYGTNQDLPGVTPTVRRLGGNRTTGYNWENNASNAGKDWLHSSDAEMTAFQGIPAGQSAVPAIALTHFHDRSVAAGVRYTILTLPMAGYVAADENGPVSPTETAPSARWAVVKNMKPGAFAYPPNLKDGVVYVDELLNLLVTRYGPASGPTRYAGGRVFAFGAKNPDITERARITDIQDNQFTYTLPPLTAAHFVLEAAGHNP